MDNRSTSNKLQKKKNEKFITIDDMSYIEQYQYFGGFSVILTFPQYFLKISYRMYC